MCDTAILQTLQYIANILTLFRQLLLRITVRERSHEKAVAVLWIYMAETVPVTHRQGEEINL